MTVRSADRRLPSLRLTIAVATIGLFLSLAGAIGATAQNVDAPDDAPVTLGTH